MRGNYVYLLCGKFSLYGWRIIYGKKIESFPEMDRSEEVKTSKSEKKRKATPKKSKTKMGITKFNSAIGVIGIFVTLLAIVLSLCRDFPYKKYEKVTMDNETFDYGDDDGLRTIGDGVQLCTFNTMWTKASNTSIHAYSDGAGIDGIALLTGPVNMEHISPERADFSSRVVTPRVGDAVLWKNTDGNYALTKIISIKDDSRGDDEDKLEFQYVIFRDTSLK